MLTLFGAALGGSAALNLLASGMADQVPSVVAMFVYAVSGAYAGVVVFHTLRQLLARNGRIMTLVGAVTGGSVGLNLLAAGIGAQAPSAGAMFVYVVGGAYAGIVGLYALRQLFARSLATRILNAAELDRYARMDGLSYNVFLLFCLGAFGVQFPPPAVFAVVFLFLLAQLSLVVWILRKRESFSVFASRGFLLALFFCSGMAALIYQIVWQRLMFTAFGIDIETVTVIVSVFMLGIGGGALLGGWLSQRLPGLLPQLFVACEFAIGVFGLFSQVLIEGLAEATQLSPLPVVVASFFVVLGVPTMLMGATLPILVAHLNNLDSHIGRAVGSLYGLNTLGSAFACFVAVGVLFALLGLHSILVLAVTLNFAVGVFAWYHCRAREATV